MAISEEKLRELAAIEPPKYLERIADFLADLTMRSSSVAVLERAQETQPIGRAGLAAQSFGQRLAGKAAAVGGQRSVEWLYALMKPYQIGPYELRQFSMWLVRWHDKLAETEVIRKPTEVQATPPQPQPLRERTLQDLAEDAPRRRLRVVAGAAAAGTEIVEVVQPATGAVRRVRIVRPAGVQQTVETIETVPATTGEPPVGHVPPREPDVISRAWRSGHRASPRPSEAAAEAAAELAPPGARKALTRALWTSNLAMAGAAAGFMLGRSSQTGALVSRITAPALLGAAGPATTGVMYAPGLAFPLSHPPVSTASWLGASPPPPGLSGFVPMPGAPLPSPMTLVTPTRPAGPPSVEMPVVPTIADQPLLRPAAEAVETHRGAMRGAFAEPLREATGAESDVGPSASSRYPSRAPSRPPSPIPGLLAAGLAGYLLGRLMARGDTRPMPADDLYVEPLPGTAGQHRARVFARSRPGSVLATLLPPAGESWGAWQLPPQGGIPFTRDILSRRERTPSHGLIGMMGLAQTAPPHRIAHDPRLGEVTIVAPPLMVASEKSERRGAAVAFDWPTLARGAGELDAAGLKRLQSVLPQGAQALYPALPKSALPPSAVNVRLAPSLLKPLLTEAYGSQAAGIAGSAAATASASAYSAPANLPALARIVPAHRPAGESTGVIGPDSTTPAGALQEAGGGQARRSAMLDFLGVPVRLAPSLGGRPELRDELAVRGVGDQQTTAQAIRPHVFNPLRQQLFPGIQTVHAEPDRPAWRRAAPHFGLRDAEPTTVLAPDSRVRKVGADAPLPQVGTDRPSGAVHPLAVPAATVAGMSGVGDAAMRQWYPMSPGAGGPSATVMSGIQSGLARRMAAARSLDDAGLHGDTSQMGPAQRFGVEGQPTLSFGSFRFGMEPGVPDMSEPRTGIRRHGTPHALAGSIGDPRLARFPTTRPFDVGDVGPPDVARGPRRPIWGQADLSSSPVQALHGGIREASTELPSGLSETNAMPGGPHLGGRLAQPSLVAAVPQVGTRRMDTSLPLAGASGAAPSLPILAGSVVMGGPMVGAGYERRPDGPGTRPTVAERMGLPALRSAVTAPNAIEQPPLIGAFPVRVPDLLPVPTPILARVDQGRVPEDRPVPTDDGRRTRPHPGVGRLELPMMTSPGPMGILPVGIGLPIPVPVLGPPMRSEDATAIPAMALPVGGMPAPASPPRMTSTIAAHAPSRYYAAVDSGPASRNLALQRAAASGGVAGGPNMPMPSAQRAQRITADTQRASALASREDGMTANEVHLLANDVWSILRRRLALEADRRGKW